MAIMTFPGCFKYLATRVGLLGTLIYETQSPWTGPEDLKQANYILLSLPKGLKFLQAVPPSESPKVPYTAAIKNFYSPLIYQILFQIIHIYTWIYTFIYLLYTLDFGEY